MDFQHNDQIRRELFKLIENKFIGKRHNLDSVRCGGLEINDFSVCFGIDVVGQHGMSGVYVKIPKADLLLKKKKDIVPLTDRDRKFAESEYESLVHLSKHWQSGDIGINFVRPIGFLKDYNAILTVRVYGGDFLNYFRGQDLLRRVRGDSHSNPVHNYLFKIGVALSMFHDTSIEEDNFKIDGILRKIETYCEQLKAFKSENTSLNSKIVKVLGFKNYTTSTHVTNTLKGLDIRNILIDREKRMFMLDPGKLKKDWKEADLARFLVTCRIIYWGSMIFFAGIFPDRSYEESFLEGYCSGNKRINKTLLNLLIIKELLKHWRMAYIALQLKAWPILLKRFLEYVYIDRFYRSQLTAGIANLE